MVAARATIGITKCLEVSGLQVNPPSERRAITSNLLRISGFLERDALLGSSVHQIWRGRNILNTRRVPFPLVRQAADGSSVANRTLVVVEDHVLSSRGAKPYEQPLAPNICFSPTSKKEISI